MTEHVLHMPYSDPSEYDFDIADMLATTRKAEHAMARTGEGDVVDCCDGEKECIICTGPFIPGQSFLQCMGCLECFHVTCVNGYFKDVINAHRKFTAAEDAFNETRNYKTEAGQLMLRNVRKITAYLRECLAELRRKCREAEHLCTSSHLVPHHEKFKLIEEIYMLQNEICLILSPAVKQKILSDTWYGVRDFLPWRDYSDQHELINEELWKHVPDRQGFITKIHDVFSFVHTDPSLMCVQDLISKSGFAINRNREFILKHNRYKERNLTTMELLRLLFLRSYFKQAKEERQRYNTLCQERDGIVPHHNAVTHRETPASLNTFQRASICPKCRRDWSVHPPYRGSCPDKLFEHFQRRPKQSLLESEVSPQDVRKEIRKLEKQRALPPQWYVSRDHNEARSSRPGPEEQGDVDLVSRAPGQITHTRYFSYPPDSGEKDYVLDYETDFVDTHFIDE